MPQMRNGRITGLCSRILVALGSEGGDLIGGADLHAVAGGFPVESALQAAGEGNGIAGGALRIWPGRSAPRECRAGSRSAGRTGGTASITSQISRPRGSGGRWEPCKWSR